MNVGVWNGGVGPPPPVPSGAAGPPCGAQFPGPHDLGADPGTVPLGEGVVDTPGAAGLADYLAPKPGGEHPLTQPLAGVTERCVAALTFAGREPSSEMEKLWTRASDMAGAP